MFTQAKIKPVLIADASSRRGPLLCHIIGYSGSMQQLGRSTFPVVRLGCPRIRGTKRPIKGSCPTPAYIFYPLSGLVALSFPLTHFHYSSWRFLFMCMYVHIWKKKPHHYTEHPRLVLYKIICTFLSGGILTVRPTDDFLAKYINVLKLLYKHGYQLCRIFAI